MRFAKTTCLAFLLTLLLCSSLLSATYRDETHGFEITPPENWKTKAYQDGDDRLFDAMSPDQNVLIRVRAISLPPYTKITYDQLQQVYQQKKVDGIAPYLTKDVSVNGISGKTSFYNWKYNNHDINVLAWFAILPDKAYILTRIIPQALLGQREKQANAVMRSFTVPGEGQDAFLATAPPAAPQAPSATPRPAAPAPPAPVQPIPPPAPAKPVSSPAPASSAPLADTGSFPAQDSWPNADLFGLDLATVRQKLDIPSQAPFGNWQVSERKDGDHQLVLYVDKAKLNVTVLLQLEFKKNRVVRVITGDDQGRQVKLFFYDNGAVKAAESRLNGVLDGNKYAYYPDGSPKCVYGYRSAGQGYEDHGRSACFENGRLQSERFYDRNKKVGVWRIFEKGQLYQEETWSDGRSVDKKIYQNGKVVQHYTN